METGPALSEEQIHRRLSFVFLAIGPILLVISYFIGISDNPTGITVLLLGAFLLILGIVYLFVKSGGRKAGQDLLYWAPRVLCVTYALFASIFALDVFEEGQGFFGTALALLMHLIPTFLVLALLWVSWSREWIGGYLFVLLAVLYIAMSWGKPFATWSTLLIMAGPLVLTGALFLLNWYYRSTLRGGSSGGTIPLWLIPGIVALGFGAIALISVVSIPKTESVTFRIDAPAAGQVFVAGSFNKWDPRQYPLSRQEHGQWQTTISLPAGRHEYKFIVDTEWVHDVNNPDKVALAPPMHGYNSVITVGRADSLSSSR